MTGLRWMRPAIVFIGLVAGWQAVVMLSGVPAFILPAPADVAAALLRRGDIILDNAWVTAIEITAGFAIGSGIGIVSALTMSLFKPAREWLMPSRSLPSRLSWCSGSDTAWNRK